MNHELIVTSIGIIFSIIFSIITTAVMIRQRKESYKPKILPLNKEANISFHQENDKMDILIFPNILFKNIGLGTASSIEFEFSIDEKKFVLSWESLLGNKCPYVFGDNVIGYGKGALLHIDLNRKVNINYLVQNDEIEIEVPYFIKYILCDFISRSIKIVSETDNNNFHEPDVVFPNVLLRIKCRDFAGGKSITRYSVDLKVLTFSDSEVKVNIIFS